MIFIVQPDYLAIDPSHTPRAIYTFVPLGLQFLARTLHVAAVKAGAHMHFVDLLDIHASTKSI